ncbi:MAG: beta-galactosidase [Victivallales bacterium]|nr:beta-galactosidase [Victivallales bacterium]
MILRKPVHFLWNAFLYLVAVSCCLHYVVAQENGSHSFPSCRIVQKNGISCIEVDGEIINPTHFWTTAPRETSERNAADLAGLRLIAVDLKQAGLYENGYDFTDMDALLEHHLKVNPDARFILYVNFDGRFHRWWVDAHPEVWCRPEDGSDKMGAYGGNHKHLPSFGSPLWRQTFSDLLINIITHLKSTNYVDKIVGFHVVSGISYEWMHWGSQNNQLCDYSECGQEDFRRFLATKYASDAELQSAWNQPDVTLVTATVPSGERRRHAANGHYYDPKTERDVLDYHEYQHYVISHCIDELGKTIKDATDNRCLVGAFFGYTCYMADSGFFGQSAGHFDVRTVLDSPNVDYLIAPVAYSGRRHGDTTNTMTCAWSCNANGKLFFNHADFRTHHTPEGADYRVDTLQEAIDVLQRELARNLAEGNAIQIFDFSTGWTLDDPQLCQTIRQIQELMGKYRLAVKDFSQENYLLVVVDEKVMGHNELDNPPLDRELIYYQLMNLAMAGIPWRCVLLSDLRKHEELQHYGAYLFLNLFRLDDKTIQFLQEKILTDNRLAAFVGPVGILAPEGITTKNLETLFDEPFRLATEPLDMRSKGTDVWSSIQGMHWGTTDGKLHGYQLLPKNPPATEVIGKLLDGQDAALYQLHDNYQIFWSAAPGLKPALLRELAIRAGIPVISTSNDGIYAGCGFIGIHAHTDGEKTLRLIGTGAPRELLSDIAWPEGTTEITLRMRKGETRIFVME